MADTEILASTEMYTYIEKEIAEKVVKIHEISQQIVPFDDCRIVGPVAVGEAAEKHRYRIEEERNTICVGSAIQAIYNQDGELLTVDVTMNYEDDDPKDKTDTCWRLKCTLNFITSEIHEFYDGEPMPDNVYTLATKKGVLRKRSKDLSEYRNAVNALLEDLQLIQSSTLEF